MSCDITIAIVSYKTPKLADQCAASINTGELRARTVIVETGDATATPPAPTASRFFMPGFGYAAALDRVFRDATSPYLIAVNADVEFPVESIEPLIVLFGTWPSFAVIGPRQVNPAGQLVHAGILEAGSPSGGRSYGERNIGQYKTELEMLPQVSGSVMLIRNQAYRETGGMRHMPHLYYEDALFCWRLRHAGWHVGYSGLLTFTHHVAASPMPTPDRAALAGDARKAWRAETGLD